MFNKKDQKKNFGLDHFLNFTNELLKKTDFSQPITEFDKYESNATI